MLIDAPTNSEITNKLKRTKHTVPGKDKIGYIRPKPLDIKALFIESIFQAIHRIGTPFAGDSAKLLLDKKIIDGITLNLVTLAYLTMHKLYSGILSNRLIIIATNTKWILHEQNRLLSFLKEIQENTYLLETAILRSEKKRNDLHI